MISRYIHNDQPSKDDEEIDIGSMKLIDFSWRIQKKIQPHKREE